MLGISIHPNIYFAKKRKCFALGIGDISTPFTTTSTTTIFQSQSLDAGGWMR